MDCSMPGFPVQQQLLEFAQTHVHWVGDAIQPSHPLLSPSPPVLNLSQHQDLFQWVNSSHQVAEVLDLSIFFPMNIQSWLPLGLMVWSPCGPRTLKSLLQKNVIVNRRYLVYFINSNLLFNHLLFVAKLIFPSSPLAFAKKFSQCYLRCCSGAQICWPVLWRKHNS